MNRLKPGFYASDKTSGFGSSTCLVEETMLQSFSVELLWLCWGRLKCKTGICEIARLEFAAQTRSKMQG